MAKQTLFLGTTANDFTGTTLRAGGEMINENFTELYDATAFADNPTTLALSEATLDATYPTAEVGFRVNALDIIANPLVYTKVTGRWISTVATVVV